MKAAVTDQTIRQTKMPEAQFQPETNMRPAGRGCGPRRGVTIIETVVIIAVSAVLLSIAAVAFARFLQVRTRGQEHLERTLQTARLAEQFRRDVWGADSAAIADDAGRELRLTSDDRQVMYRIEDQRITRQETGPDSGQAGDSFRLPGVVPLRFQADRAKVQITLAADIQTDPDQPAHGPPFSIIALLGRDGRLVAEGGIP